MAVDLGSTFKELIDEINSKGGSVQPDYNQNNSAAADYIKNRPFYSGYGAIFSETISTVVEGSHSYASAYSTSKIDVQAGVEAEVLINNNEGSYTVQELQGIIYIGNLSILVSSLANTGETFLVICNFNLQTQEDGCTILTTEPLTNVQFKILADSIHHLDSKYLSSDVLKTQSLPSEFSIPMDLGNDGDGINSCIISPGFIMGSPSNIVRKDYAALSTNRIWFSEANCHGYLNAAELFFQDDILTDRSATLSSGVLTFSDTGGETSFSTDGIKHKNKELNFPTAAGTLATQEYVTEQIGNIDTLLTALNSGTGV